MAKTKNSRRRPAKSRSQREVGGLIKATKNFNELLYLRGYTVVAVEKINEMAEYVTAPIPEMLGDVAALANGSARQPSL